jgi:hypothetical protein
MIIYYAKTVARLKQTQLVDGLIDCPPFLTRKYTMVVIFCAEATQLSGAKSLLRIVCRSRLPLVIERLRCLTGDVRRY